MTLDKELGFKIDKHGNRLLKGKVFNKTKLSSLDLSVDQPGQDIIIEDCSFVQCELDPGRFVFWGGVVLRNVLFDNIKHGGEIMIHPNTCVLDRVTIKRKSKTLLLWIRPPGLEADEAEAYRRWSKKHARDTEFMLDISEFHADVDVYGFPLDKVITNPECHVKLQLDRPRIDCDREGITSFFWQISLGNIADYVEQDGLLPTAVVRLPPPKHRDHEAVVAELETLKRLHVLVD